MCGLLSEIETGACFVIPALLLESGEQRRKANRIALPLHQVAV